MTAAEAAAKAREYLEALEDLRARGQVDDDSFHKVLVCLSWEQLNAGNVVEGLTLLRRVPPEYTQAVQGPQMATDTEYRDVVIRLACYLVRYGLVEFAGGWEPTQGPGCA